MGGSTYYCESVSEWQGYTGDEVKCNSSKLEQCYLSPTVLQNNVIFAKGDSGATSHYIRIEDSDKCLDNIKKYDGPSVMLPDAGTIKPTLQGQLLLSNKLSKQAQRATVLPALKSSSLISLGQLCDNDCTVILDKNKMLAIKKNEVILRGCRNYLDGLWNIPIESLVYS